jgi:cytochrome P450
VDERRVQSRSGPEEEQEDDLLSLLLYAQDEETGEGMSDKQLRDELMTLLIAGHETTSNLLSWVFYILSKHPDVRDRLHAELDQVLGGRPPEAGDLRRLSYTKMVLEETLRLYPPAWISNRSSREPDVICGYHIPAKTFIAFSPYVIHRHPDFWPEPETFDPERFAPGEDSARPRYAYIPFGGGPHLCIGRDFAMMEATLVVATVLQHVDLRLVPGTAVRSQALATLRPRDGLPMLLTPRPAR